MPILIGVLTISASLGGMYLQSRLDSDRYEQTLHREKLEKLLDLALQVESGINRLPSHLLSGPPSDDLSRERIDVPHKLRQLMLLSNLYFPKMAASVNVFSQRVALTLTDYETCFKSYAESDDRKKCLLNGDPTHSTASALSELFDDARREMTEIGASR